MLPAIPSSSPFLEFKVSVSIIAYHIGASVEYHREDLEKIGYLT